MNIGIHGVTHNLHVGQAANEKSIALNKQENQRFSDALKLAINNVNNSQKEADIKTELLATGKIEDLHDVMITAQKATITLETAVQIQQKAIDAYNEIMRMQV